MSLLSTLFCTTVFLYSNTIVKMIAEKGHFLQFWVFWTLLGFYMLVKLLGFLDQHLNDLLLVLKQFRNFDLRRSKKPKTDENGLFQQFSTKVFIFEICAPKYVLTDFNLKKKLAIYSNLDLKCSF